MLGYEEFLARNNLTEDLVQGMMAVAGVAPYDQSDSDVYYIGSSSIHGIGCFASTSIQVDTVLGYALVHNEKQTLGRYVNHSDVPNCIAFKSGGDVCIQALTDLEPYEELTLDYNHIYSLTTGAANG